MHSTVQTGLFTPKIFNYGYNFHHPNSNSSVSHMHREYPPPPVSFQHHHHHSHNQQHHQKQSQQNSQANMSRSKTDLNATLLKKSEKSKNKSSIEINLLGIDDMKRQNSKKMALSASNIPYLFATSQTNLNLNKAHRSNSICSSQSSPLNRKNIVNQTNLNDLQKLSMSSQINRSLSVTSKRLSLCFYVYRFWFILIETCILYKSNDGRFSEKTNSFVYFA